MTDRVAGPVIEPEDVEELRLALVLNGGVSLAVWIGGVAAEINRLVRKQGIYGGLLSATATEARVDVISGTSAGGINGALLALATVFDSDLAPLREVWLRRGSLDTMLRSPVAADPPSLLLGDDYFFPELVEAFRSIRRTGRREARAPDEAPIELTLTATLLHGCPNTIADDFGTVIADVDHRAQFVFRRGPDVGHDSFADDRIAHRLAFAARATSSFPVAFEPRFYPSDDPDGALAPPLRDTRNLAKSRFLLDGGILDNKPLESAVEAVFKQRAERDVRRILAYVVPNPGASGDAGHDDKDAVPGIGQVAIASLMELPRVESISAQIRAVGEHNRKVRRKHQNRAGVMALDRGVLHALAASLFPVYRRRRLESSGDYLLGVVSDGMAAETNNRRALGRRLREWIVEQFLLLPDQVPWVPGPDFAHAFSTGHTRWSWGVFALENMADMMLDVLKRTLRLTTPRPEDRATRRALMELRRTAFDLFGRVRATRFDEPGFWRGQGKALMEATRERDDGLDAATAARWMRGALAAWQARFAEKNTEGEVVLDSLAREMAGVIGAAARIFRARFSDAESWARTGDRRRHATLRRHFDVLAPESADENGKPREPSAYEILENLLVVEVVVNAFGSYRDVRDQYVEMLQVSADVPTAFGGPSTAAKKLAGAQLANFGAFLKRSWRANDWMFGRLDGAERLSLVLVNPERLRRLFGTYAACTRDGGTRRALEVVHALAVEGIAERADRVYLEKLWREQLEHVEHELAYLDSDDIPVPEQLPHCAAALTRRLHLEILRDELPEVARAVAYDLQQGANPRGFGAEFELAVRQALATARGKPLAPETIVTLFRGCDIGRERIDQEVGSDLVTALASRATAVAITAGAGEHSNLGPVRRLFKLGRLPAIGFNFLADGLVKQSRTGVALFTAALTVGAALLALGAVYVDEMPGALWTAGTVLFVAAIATAFMRRSGLALAAVLVLGFVLLLGTDLLAGAVSADTLGILRGAAVGIFLFLVSALAYAVSKGPTHRRGEQPGAKL